MRCLFGTSIFVGHLVESVHRAAFFHRSHGKERVRNESINRQERTDSQATNERNALLSICVVRKTLSLSLSISRTSYFVLYLKGSNSLLG